MSLGAQLHPGFRSPARIRADGGRCVGARLALLLVALIASGAMLVSSAAFNATWGAATAYAKSPPPADLFMRSIVTDDGTLGWEQLCPSARMQVPEDVLVKQADAERRVRAQQGLTLSMDFIGARRRPGGGELRVYIVTGQWPSGTIDMRTYSVLTQSSGCVENVNSQ